MPKSGVTTDLLPPVDIPGRQPPIPGDVDNADYGIGLRHVEHPLVVHIDRPDNTPPGTVFQLFWGSLTQPVAFNLLGDGDEGLTRIPFTVTQDHIRESWADPVFARVLRENGTNSETRPLRLRVNLQRPGGRDPDDNLPGHQKLILELPLDVVRDGISDARAHQGVEVICRHWENMAAYDLVILAWGSETITHQVRPDQVARDISLTIDYPTILAAGNGEIIPVGFQVMGPTGNYPDEWARWSAIQFIDVYTNTNRPDAPRVLFPATEREIDLAELGGQNVKVEVYVNQTDARNYSLVTLVWAGTDSEGEAVPLIASKDLSGYGPYEFEVDNTVVTAIAKGTAVVCYLLQGAGIPDKRSNNRHLRINGEISRWPAPIIDQAPVDYLDPNSPEATVRVPANASWPSEALLEVVFMAGGSNGTIEHRIGRRVGEIPPTPQGHMLFTVYTANLKRFEGYLTDVYYVLSQRNTTPGSIPQESMRLELQIGELLRDMPAPIIEKASGGQLDPDAVTDYAKVFAPFTGTQRYDWITLRWIGPLARTSVKVQVAVNGATTEHDIGTYFIQNNLHEQVMVYYTLAREGQPLRYSHITSVQIARGLGELQPPELLKSTVTGPGTAMLSPLTVQSGTQLVVSYTGMRDSDTIQMSMRGTAGAGSPAIAIKQGNQLTRRVEFDISKAAIAANIGNGDKIIKFDYMVVRDGNPKPSPTLTVTVTPIPVGNLPRPLINSIATGGSLDITGFGSSTVWSIDAYPFQVSNEQLIWLTYKGTDTNNQATEFAPWAGAINRHAGAYTYNPNHNWFRTLKDKSILSIEVRIAFDRINNKALAVVFPLTQYTVLSTPAFAINQAQMNLNGLAVKIPTWQRTGADAPGNTEVRTATGGSPPYTYSSNNTTVASVNATTGKVTGEKNGLATVTVVDSDGRALSYSVVVSNIWTLSTSDGPYTGLQSAQWMNSLGGRTIYNAEVFNVMKLIYIFPVRPSVYVCALWRDQVAYPDFYSFLHPNTLLFSANKSAQMAAWCVVPF